jgi:hypothetical protein
MQPVEDYVEVRAILAGAERRRSRQSILRAIAIGAALAGVVVAAGTFGVRSALDNARLAAEVARLEGEREAQDAVWPLKFENDRLTREVAVLRGEVAALRARTASAAAELDERVGVLEAFVIEDLAETANWRDGRPRGSLRGALLREFKVNEVSELTRRQYHAALAWLHERRKGAARRSVDPAG